MIEIYLDENLSEYVADALNSLNAGYFKNIIVFSTKRKFGKGRPDEEIIPRIGRQKAVLITKDLNIHRTRAQYDLCQKFKIGCFFIKAQKGNDKHWVIVKMLIENWETMVKISEEEKFPFAYEIPFRGKLRKL